VDGFIAVPSVCVSMAFDPSGLLGGRSFLVLVFAVQTVIRGSGFNRAIGFISAPDRARV
jgi:hypothetical protein